MGDSARDERDGTVKRSGFLRVRIKGGGRSGGEDVGGGGPGGRGMEMRTLRFSMAEVRRGGRISTVDAIPGTRRTTRI